MEMLHIHNKLSPLFLLFIYLLAFSLVHSTNPVKYFINCGSDSSVNVSGRIFVGDINSNSSFTSGYSVAFSLVHSTNPVKYFINCGSDSSVNVSGRIFVGDINSNSSFTSGYSEAIYSSSPLPNNSSLYQTAGLYRQKSQYELSITKHGTYLVCLHFFAFKSQGIKLTDALFDVSTSNFLLLSNFRAQNSFPVIKEFFLTINEGKLEIQFLPSSFAFINAIEVILLPSDFIMDNDTAVRPVKTKSGFYHDLLPEALQTIHRINVGGPEVKEANDSLWRNWKHDDDYVISSTSAKTCAFFNGTYGETLEATEYFAPDIVYRTCKEVKDNSKEADLLKITWRFSVRNNTRHFVRFHFCNNIGAVFGFNLYIDGEKTENINTYNYPNFYHLVVDSEDSGYINISVGPDDYIDKTAYLNGLEIMEFVMNKSLVVSLEGQPNKSIFVVVGPIIGVLALICILAVVIGLCLRYRKPNTLENWEWSPMPVHRGASSQNRMPKGSVISSHLPDLNLGLKISFAEIQFATNNFDGERIVGKGGFGHVFRGTLRNGTRVAVKRSQPGSSQGLLEFQTEIMVLSKISHRHLVSLIGYCDEMSEMILVYEFMEKGTLRDHLYNSALPSLSWKLRLEICIGAAKGLHYLHRGSAGGFIHRDVKSTNILLDEDLVAKVADFGISRVGPPDQTHVSTGVKGTFGYLDPDYFRTLQLTEKSDVYSFGVVLLEALCARPAINIVLPWEQVNLAEWGMICKNKGTLDQIVDPSIKSQINPNSLRKFAEVAEKCLQKYGADRPAMGDVLWDLEYTLQLQQTAIQRQPHDDSAIDASTLLGLQRFPSLSMSVEKYDREDTENT